MCKILQGLTFEVVVIRVLDTELLLGEPACAMVIVQPRNKTFNCVGFRV